MSVDKVLKHSRYEYYQTIKPIAYMFIGYYGNGWVKHTPRPLISDYNSLFDQLAMCGEATPRARRDKTGAHSMKAEALSAHDQLIGQEVTRIPWMRDKNGNGTVLQG